MTGATGYIGSAVARLLTKEGHTVLGTVRRDAAADQLQRAGIVPIPGDLQVPATLLEAVRIVEPDAVIHTAFIHDFGEWEEAVRADRAAVAAFAAALAGTGKTLISTSGTGFLGDTGSIPVDESFPADPASPFRARADAERDVLRAADTHGLRTVVLRLPLYVYGNGGSVFVPARISLARKHGFSPFIGGGENRVSALHVEDAARLYLSALNHAPAGGTLYHGAAESGITDRAIAEAIGRFVEVPAQSVTRTEADTLFGPGLAAFFAINSQISADKAQQELGGSPQAKSTLLTDIEFGSYRAAA